MHSRIFQIESFPIDKDCRITEDNYIGDHWFVYSIADYVTEDEDRENSLEWLMDTLSCAESFIEFFRMKMEAALFCTTGFMPHIFKRSIKVSQIRSKRSPTPLHRRLLPRAILNPKCSPLKLPMMTDMASMWTVTKPGLSR